MSRAGGLVLGALVVAAPLTAQYPGGMGGMGRMGGGRRGAMTGSRSGPNLPTEPELEGPPDLQTLALSADIDTTGLSGYRGVVIAYLDSTRAARDSVWVVLQRLRPGGAGGMSAPAGDSLSARGGGIADAERIWSGLKKQDEQFEKKVLKSSLPKQDYKKWKKWHDDEVDQAKKDRENEMQRRREGMRGGDDIRN